MKGIYFNSAMSPVSGVINTFKCSKCGDNYLGDLVIKGDNETFERVLWTFPSKVRRRLKVWTKLSSFIKYHGKELEIKDFWEVRKACEEHGDVYYISSCDFFADGEEKYRTVSLTEEEYFKALSDLELL